VHSAPHPVRRVAPRASARLHSQARTQGIAARAQALFDYNAIEADELSLLRGETMVVYGSPEEAWYECELHGRVSAASGASVAPWRGGWKPAKLGNMSFCARWSLTCSHVVGSQLRCTPIFLPSPRSIFACVLRFGETNMVVRLQVGMVPANYVRLLPPKHEQGNKVGGREDDAKLRRAKSHDNIGGSSTRERSGPEVMQTDGLGEMSEETMSKRRQVYERLYSMGVVKVKKQQHMQEQKRREQEEKLKKERQQVTANLTKLLVAARARVPHTHTHTHTHTQVNAKSMKMSAARKPDMGANYGEFLYNQGMERRDLKAEQVRLIKHNEQMEEEKETTFTPRISETSKNLRRDMPVVERLFMLDQVKAEKIGTLKRAVELEERRKGTFAPQINPNYQLKKGARTDVTKSHLDTQKRAFQRQAMQERLDRELGVTHKPTLNDRSRQIAGSSRADLRARTCLALRIVLVPPARHFCHCTCVGFHTQRAHTHVYASLYR